MLLLSKINLEKTISHVFFNSNIISFATSEVLDEAYITRVYIYASQLTKIQSKLT